MSYPGSKAGRVGPKQPRNNCGPSQDQVLGPGSGLFWIFPWLGTGARIRFVLDIPLAWYWGQDQVCFGYSVGLVLGPGSGLFWIIPWPGTGAKIRFVLDIPLAWY